METLGQRIKFLRGSEPHDVFAARIGVSKASISGYERDKNSPSADVIIKICSSNNISVEWLLFGTGPMRNGERPEGEISTIASAESTEACPRCAHLEQRLEATSDKLVETLQTNVALVTELGQQKLENVKLAQQLDTARQMCREYASAVKKTDAQDPLFDEQRIIPSSDANLSR